ncbi:MAG: 2-dehydropantoate 2-reductase [Ktedonobacterales bacterium]
MRILVVGAGSIGGYFGGRLLNAGRDVAFLVRPRRAAQLARTGLVIRSPLGDLDLPAPPTISAEALSDREPFDLILLSCKAYDLDGAIDSFAPAVGSNTAILPLLNGMQHLDILEERFGPDRVLGGQCVISTALDPEGRILHLGEVQSLSFGARDGSRSGQIEAIAAELSGAGFDSRLSESILQEMWEKWVFIAAGAGITCLMRSSVGDIVTAGAGDLITALLDECAAIAARQGFVPSEASMRRSRAMLTAPGSGLTASMFRDIERGAPIEADHIIGDLLRRGESQHMTSPLLRVAYAHLKTYEASRARELASASNTPER